MENWRVALYYPLGALPAVFFFLRFFIQWIKSEKKQESFVDQTFWLLSIAGNSFAMVHYFIQLQYWYLIIQTGNLVIAYRNIHLIKNNHRSHSLKNAIVLMITSLISISGLFFIQKHLFFNHIDLLTSPIGTMQEGKILQVSFGWHLLGILGSGLFASRFWYQWWKAEKNCESQLDAMFWKISIGGSLLVLIYSLVIRDLVSFIQFSFGLIPFVRNLILIHAKSLSQKHIP